MVTTLQLNKRSRAEQSDILEAFATRLREYSIFSDNTVDVCDQSVPTVMPQGELAIVVSPGGGSFPQELWEGGHHATATENGRVIVGIYKRSLRDRPGRRESGLLDKRGKSPGLLELKRVVLQFLTVASLKDGVSSQPWEPILVDPRTDTSRPLLRDLPIPISVTPVLDVPEHKGWIGLQITFACSWDWELYRA